MAIRHTAGLNRIASTRSARVAPLARPGSGCRRASLVCSSVPVSTLMDLAAGAPGTVDAPIGVVIGGAIVVTIAATAIIPIWLNPGQEAADKIFQAKQGKPLDSKKKGK